MSNTKEFEVAVHGHRVKVERTVSWNDSLGGDVVEYTVGLVKPRFFTWYENEDPFYDGQMNYDTLFGFVLGLTTC